MYDVIAIGAGPAGMAAAIEAARSGQQVLLLEASERVGSKILATGNGRCNLTNTAACAANYNAPEFVAPALQAMPPAALRAWFEELGLLTFEEREGRVYPLSNTATSVLDVLRSACERFGVEVRCNCTVEGVERTSSGQLQVRSTAGESFEAHRVVVACGGGSQLLGACGHSLVPAQPVLCSLACDATPIRGLNGVRVAARISLQRPGKPEALATEEGELLFRDYGVSGIAIFNLSRFACAGDVLVVDLLPALDEGALVKLLQQRIETLGGPSNEGLLVGMLHPAVVRAVLRAAKLKVSAPAQACDCGALAHTIKAFSLPCTGVGDAAHAQVTRGGAALSEFDPTTLESKLVSGLYAAGEALDIDGPCGGYNLQWAFASGLLAAR